MKIRTNLVTGIVMGIASIILLLMVPSQVPVPAYDSGAPSPRIIPIIVLSGILISSIGLILQSLVFKREKIMVFDLKQELPAIILIGMICVFTVVIIQLGFIAGILVFFPALLWYMGERKPLVYVISIIIGVLIYFLFAQVFHISLPTFFS